MVISYELQRAALRNAGHQALAEDDYWDIEKATGEQVEHLYEHLERVLIRLDFHDVDNPRQLMQRMRRLFGRIRLDAMEMNILRGFLAHIEYHLDNPQIGDHSLAEIENIVALNSESTVTVKSKKESNKPKDFAEAKLNKRQVDTMATILKQASKKKE
jgi:hypothetical protein